MESEGTELERAIAAAARQGEEAWNGLVVPLPEFATHVARVGAGLQELASHGVDLYLACGCAREEPLALRMFDERLLPAVDRHLARMGLGASARDEVRQLVRVRLFTENRRILTYSGRGSLGGWLRIVAARIAFERGGARQPGEATDESDIVNRLISAGADPELGLTRRQFRERFQRALDDSFAALSPRARTVLRMHYVDGLNIEAIGIVYHVHRATVARWLVGIRAAVMAGLRERLAITARPTSSDFRSLAAALRDELHISVERVLAEQSAEGQGEDE